MTIQRGASFSPCRTWRYFLYRRWDASLSSAMMTIGLNPSTADENVDDNTVRRCIQYAKDWGYGELWMMNLFAFRATDPKVMQRASDPVGPENDEWLKRCAKEAGLVLAAWGNHGTHLDRARQVRHAIGRELHHLGLTKSEQPKHPLYLKKDLKPVLWRDENYV